MCLNVILYVLFCVIFLINYQSDTSCLWSSCLCGPGKPVNLDLCAVYIERKHSSTCCSYKSSKNDLLLRDRHKHFK